MTELEVLEALSYVVTIIGFPFAIAVFIYENRRERQNEDEELHQRLSDEYANFLKVALDNADLQLLRKHGAIEYLTDEQKERKLAIFGILVSIFERAYILVYDDGMNKQTRRLWSSWEDFMREWCSRGDFRAVLPDLLEGEDDDFRAHIMKIARAQNGFQNQKSMGGSMTQAIPEGYSTLTAVLTFKDTKRAIEFYKKAFGAKQEFIMDRPGSQGVAHAVIRIGNSPVMMDDEWKGGPSQSAEKIGQSPVAFYLYVPDVDASYKQAVTAGATSVMPVSDMFWGDRMGTVQDPFGYRWSLATHVKDPSEKDLTKGVESTYAQPAASH